MMHGYSYLHDPQQLRDAGAEQVWLDLAPGRYERSAMMRAGALRPGDTLLVYSMHNLTGSAKSFERWRADLESRGVSLKILDAPARPVGRPKKYDPDPAAARRHWAIWTDGTRSERERLATIAADNGSEVTRQTLNGRYGNPSNPKARPE